MTAAFTVYALIGVFVLGVGLGAASRDADYPQQFRGYPWWLWMWAIPSMILTWPLAVWRGLKWRP